MERTGRARRKILLAMASLGLLALGGTGASPDGKVDPENCTWNLSFETFFPPGRRGPRPMKIYAVRRGGAFLHALGSSPTWNTCCHTVDVTGITFAEGRLEGRLGVILHPDPWVPADGKPRTAALAIDARVDRAHPDREGAIEGTYEGSFDGKAVSGTLTGRLSAPEMTSFGACRFGFALVDALEGGGNRWDRRLRIEFDVFDGKPSGARFGPTDMRGNPRGLTPFRPTRIEISEHAFTAEFTIPYEVVGAIEDAHAAYAFRVEGKRVNDLIGGRFAVRVHRESHADVVKRGGFKGWIRPAERTPRSIWSLEKDDRPWFVPTAGWKPLQPGEHPRLFFRKSDLPELRRRARTPEGRRILARLRATLGGGESMPEHFRAAKKAYDPKKQDLPEGAYTISHAAGFGFLYQLTGRGKYADLARRCVERAFRGQRDRDDRYAWVAPGGELRAAPTVAWYALAYDLCYDAWDPAFRGKVCRMIQDYDDGRAGEWGKPEGVTLHAMAMCPKQPPGSNHFGSVVGGAGIAVLAILGDPGTDGARLKRYLEKIEENTVLALTRGFGDHGYFAENAGPSHVAANTALVPFLQAMKIAGGRDYLAPRPNARWLTLRWAMGIVPDERGRPFYPCRKPSSYGGPDFLRPVGGMSHGGWFAQGFGAIREEEKPALLWVYEHFIARAEGRRYTATNYPHRAVLALINWPIGVEPRNPAAILPRAVADRIHGYYIFRNRWRDARDILVTVLLGSGPEGHIRGRPGDVMVWGLGERRKFGRFGPREQTTYYRAAEDGSGAVSGSRGNRLAVDFSGASGAEALLVMAGPGAVGGRVVSLGRTPIHILTLPSGDPPPIRVRGGAVVIGAQGIRLDAEKIVLATLEAK